MDLVDFRNEISGFLLKDRSFKRRSTGPINSIGTRSEYGAWDLLFAAGFLTDVQQVAAGVWQAFVRYWPAFARSSAQQHAIFSGQHWHAICLLPAL